MKIPYNKWKFLNELRLQYNLNKDSIVFDIGAYKGEFARDIIKMYGCRVYCFEPVFKVKAPGAAVMNVAVSSHNSIGFFGVDKDSTGSRTEGPRREVEYITMTKAMRMNNVNHIDLLKINIEGDEYDLLEHMIEKNLLRKCDNIQVQFHRIEGSLHRYRIIRAALERTHQLTFRIPWVWENWELV